MEPDFSPLAEFLGDEFDGYLISADGGDSNQLYLSGFDAPDPYVTLYTPEGIHLLVSTLEFGRAKKESRADTVSRLSDYDYRDKHAEHGAVVGKAKTVAAFLADHEVDSLAVPADFPLGTADGLRDEGVAVEAETDDVLTNIRAVKTDEEVEHVHAAQDANEAAMRAAEGLIRDADVADDGTLTHEGDPLTSERVREEIEVALLRHGCALDETIVACGADAADPHDRGSGPLRADEAVIIDIFPRDKETKYNGDMTRTFVKGEPSPEIRAWFDLTEEAFEAALDAVEPGATGKDVHDAVCNVYEAAGENTLRADPAAETGFIHSTGHGVGLDVHELPSLSPSGEELRPGHVITIEPGLYDPDIGGVRIEDLVVVTEDGYENLTEYPIELVVE
ncbi:MULTISPECIES: Xaa-Pro peptidase family protein [unclassified Haloferax]|uniref:M24 family metallopeptidase n=1 Tax=unclassified Haloferax TaxID=2625095 RepID=UPI002875ECD7|nr:MULTISPECIES: Xaa-Pro peptidase family protein [unclassified Haloferax]MDS0240080.1 Xaa-Pro peptidase family protein [Haloferax sp. S2CR25]MDS0443201.1 Xaa-Pro peptidase family protein [Haloferax sp. S2CR25-2]